MSFWGAKLRKLDPTKIKAFTVSNNVAHDVFESSEIFLLSNQKHNSLINQTAMCSKLLT